MSGNSKAMPFHGILAMGNTKDEAVNRYRLLALGKGVSAMKDAGGNLAFVTHASNKIAEMFNPQSGELDLSRDDSILSKLQFEAKAGEVEANHYVCESGCGLHMVYDSESLVKHCPSCTTAIASDEDEAEDEDDVEETDDDLEDEDSEEEDEDMESESADDDEESEDDDSEEDGEEDDEEEIEGGSDDDADDEEESDEDDEEDEESDDEDDGAEEEDSDDEEEEDDSGEPLVIAADSKEKAIEIYRQNRIGIATAATTVEVDYVLCSSQECNAHIISEDPSLTQCPACESDVKQPEAAPVVSQSGEDEEDEEEDDTDLEVIPDDEESEEDEEDTSESNTQPESGNNMNVENVTVDMLKQINDTAEDAHKGLDVSFSRAVAGAPMWTAYFNGLPVATASKTNAGKNADIFEDAAFGQAVIAGARHVGVVATLNEMGFKGIAHEISLNSVVTDRVNAQVAEAKAGLERDRAEHAERLMAALATAAIGINRGFFQDTNNPVKAALWNAMSSAGVKNAEVLIDNAFRTSNDDYHRTLFAKASEIIGQPLEVQESLSKAVLGTNYMNAPTATASSNSNSNFEDRLELGRSTATASDKEEEAKPNQESTSSDAERISRTVAGLGRRRS